MGSGFSKKNKKKNCVIALDSESSVKENIDEKGDFKEKDFKAGNPHKDESLSQNLSNKNLSYELNESKLINQADYSEPKENLKINNNNETLSDLDKVRKIFEELTSPSNCVTLNSSSVITNFSLNSLKILNKTTQTEETIWNLKEFNKSHSANEDILGIRPNISDTKLDLYANTATNRAFEHESFVSNPEILKQYIEEKNVQENPEISNGDINVLKTTENCIYFDLRENQLDVKREYGIIDGDTSNLDTDLKNHGDGCTMSPDGLEKLETLRVAKNPEKLLTKYCHTNESKELNNETSYLSEEIKSISLGYNQYDEVGSRPEDDDLEHLRRHVNQSRCGWDEIERDD